MTSNPPKVFISYSHDNERHEYRVLALANRLRTNGIDAEIDQYEPAPPEGWPMWCEKQIREADYVLLVCSETYLRCVTGEEAPGVGHGVLWEARIIQQLLYDSGSVSRTFIPVLFSDTSANHIPTPVRGASRYFVDTEAGYEGLYRQVTKQPGVVKPALGKQTVLEPKEPRPEAAAAARSAARSFSAASQKIDSALDNYIWSTPNPQIQVLGIVLYYQWPLLDSYLSRLLSGQEPRPLAIQLALLDPDWAGTAELNEAFPGMARNTVTLIKRFISHHREQLHKRGWSIDLFTFLYTPHWFGILIGDDVLFLCRSFWNNGVLRGGSNCVEQITAGGSTIELEAINEFRELFRQCRQKQVDIGLDLTFYK